MDVPMVLLLIHYNMNDAILLSYHPNLIQYHVIWDNLILIHLFLIMPINQHMLIFDPFQPLLMAFLVYQLLY